MNDLLNYVCISVPFELIVQYEGNDYYLDGMTSWNEVQLATMDYISLNYTVPLNDIKPYLRPLSSMTEEECKELGKLSAIIENVGETLPNAPYYIEVARPEQIDWLNAHHFDYRGLIEKGLALEALEGMY